MWFTGLGAFSCPCAALCVKANVCAPGSQLSSGGFLSGAVLCVKANTCALSALGASSGSSRWASGASGFFPVFFPSFPVSFIFHLKISISSTFARKLWESQWSLLTMSVILLVSGLHRLGMYLLSFARAMHVPDRWEIPGSILV